MIVTRTAIFVCLGAALAAPARAQAPVASDPRVQTAIHLAQVWLEAERAYDQIPGVSAAIVHDQEIVWSGGYGYTDLTRRAPATPSTIYSICSISKLFTSVGVMQLRDAGKLRLDDPVGRHLSWFTIKRTSPESGEVTIEGLLTHASGLPREADYPYWTGPDFTFPTHEEIVERLSKQETLYPAETYWQYSNLGLTLAGEVVAAVSGQPYAAYVQQHILDPLGLSSTTPEIPAAERGRRLATGYSGLMRDGTRQPAPFFQARGIAPAAGYASTVEDLARFASWQFRVLARRSPEGTRNAGGRGPVEVLDANTLREMHRVHWIDQDFTNSYGLGFAVWRSNDQTFVGHGGSCPGFRSQLLLKPDERVATVFMANAQGVNSQQWAQRLYDIVAPAIRAAVKEPGKALAPDPDLAPYLGTYASSFGGEMAVVRWEDGLATLNLPTMDPVAGLAKWKKTGEHTFRRVRKDEALGEALVFEMGPDGRPVRIRLNSQFYPRVR